MPVRSSCGWDGTLGDARDLHHLSAYYNLLDHPGIVSECEHPPNPLGRQ